jgi:hypothetical protein
MPLPGVHSIATRGRNQHGTKHLPHSLEVLSEPVGSDSEFRLFVTGALAVRPNLVGLLPSRPRRMTVARSLLSQLDRTSRSWRESVRSMISTPVSNSWTAWCRASALALVLMLIGGCGTDDRVSPSSDSPVAASNPGDSTGTADSTVTPADSTTPIDSAAPSDSVIPSDSVSISPLTAVPPGIVYGTFNMTTAQLSSVHTGTLMGGPIDQNNAMTILAAVKAKGGRIVIKMCKGADSYVKNADGTFSFTKWKALVDRFRNLPLGPYIADGTILGHFLIDEPSRTAKWGGKIISQSTLEAMAKYSKQIWPGLPTLVRVVPSWLASSTITYTYLDAGWLQYTAAKGDISTMISTEVAAAKRKGLGLMTSINVLDGGNGSSKIPGLTSGKYAMSANEIRTYATALLNQSYACGFYNWQYNGSYYGRTDIKSAMAAMSLKAKAHVKTSCRQ